MRRWCAAGYAGVLAAAAAAAGEPDFPVHSPWGPNLSNPNPVPTFWIGAFSGSAADTARWSGYLPNWLYGPFLNVIVREVGAPYEITGSGLYARNFTVRSSGASVALSRLEVRDTVHLQHGTLRLRGSYPRAMAKRLLIGGTLIVEGRCDFSGPVWGQYDEGPEEFLVTGEMWCLGLAAGASGNLTRSYGDLRNEGAIIVAATAPGQYVTLEAPRIDNAGLLRIDGDHGDRERTVIGLAQNAGRIEAAGLQARIFCVDEGLTNAGDIVVEAGGSLELHASTLRHEGGLISTVGVLALHCELIEWTGGGFDSNVLLSNIRVHLMGDGPSGVVNFGPSCELAGDIPPGLTVRMPATHGAGGAVNGRIEWEGGFNRGRIEVGASNRFSSFETLINEGELVVDGWMLLPVIGAGQIRLGTYSLLGSALGENELDGGLDVAPHARAQVNGISRLRGTVHVRPTVRAILPNYQNQVTFTGPLTIDGATLEIDPGPGFAPAWGNVYNLIGASQVTGNFAAIEAAPLSDPSLRWEIERFGGSYRGRLAHIADVNRDLGIDFADINTVVAAWGTTTDGAADVDGDGVVGFGDLAIVVAHFGQYAG